VTRQVDQHELVVGRKEWDYRLPCGAGPAGSVDQQEWIARAYPLVAEAVNCDAPAA
jgi:hypothetical protein